MHSIITSYLVQTGKCALPYLGSFTTGHKPAIINEINKQILPPLEEIVFNEETDMLSPGLINYIVAKKNITESEAGHQIENFCKYWKEKIEDGDKLSFNSLGYLQKNASGKIYFTREEDSLGYLKPISAERVFHQNSKNIQTAENENITSPVVNKLYRQDTGVARSGWVIGTLMLAVMALAVLLYNIYNYGFSTSAIGNKNKFTIKAEEKTYIQLKK